MTSKKMVDVAVELGLAPPPMPELEFIDDLFAAVPEEPPVLIEGVLHQGCKMLLGGTSKSNKTWTLLDMALSIASGVPWWGHKTVRAKVAYINFELPRWALVRRLMAICKHRPELSNFSRQLALWNLRGQAADFASLRPKLESRISGENFGLIVIDPAYKLLGARDENANGDIADFLNHFERLAERTGAAIVIAHHFAKGDASGKDAIDRMSGAGAWARDPDSIMVLTPHEEENCYSVTSILRCLPQLPDYVVEWQYPLMRRAQDLDPAALRRTGARQKASTDRDFIEACLTSTPRPRKDVVRAAENLGLSARSTDRYLKRLLELGLISCGSGLYWSK